MVSLNLSNTHDSSLLGALTTSSFLICATHVIVKRAGQ